MNDRKCFAFTFVYNVCYAFRRKCMNYTEMHMTKSINVTEQIGVTSVHLCVCLSVYW